MSDAADNLDGEPAAVKPGEPGRAAAAESDRLLMSRAHDGDQAALMALLDRYLAPLYNLALRATGERELAGDVVRDALSARLRGLATAVPPGDQPWLVSLAGDVYRAFGEAGLKAHSPGRRLRIAARHWASERLHLSEEAGANAQRSGQRWRRRLARAWSRLSFQQRFVLALAESQPLSAEDQGHVLGQSAAVARNLRNEAKLALLAFLADPGKRSWRSPGQGERHRPAAGGEP